MAGSSLLALIDDIASVLDDVALMTKTASQKTAGVLGDDLALNAEQVTGVKADRELPVVWAVAKGSMRNKLILVPVAIALSAFLPMLITPLLMLGGAYLCYEGFEKLAHALFAHKETKAAEHAELTEAVRNEKQDLAAFERTKIKGAIRTDFVLSAEIIVIALGTVQEADIWTQFAVVSAVAVIMTIGVYALVAGIVKLDDAGLALIRATTANVWATIKRNTGRAILWLAPRMMKTLSVVGTVAMFLVGGGILLHGLPHLHELLHTLIEGVHSLPVIGGILAVLATPVVNTLAGIAAGGLVLGTVTLIARMKFAVSQK